MSAARLILRLVFGSVMILGIGTVLVLGFTQIVEPFSQTFGSPPASLGWGSPGSTVVLFGAISAIGLLGFIVVWLIVAPIRNDRRQQTDPRLR